MAATTTEAPPFDTRQVAEALVQDGDFTVKQASAVTEAIKTATGGLVTKADLEAAKSEITAEIHKTANAQTWKVITAIIAWTAVVIAAIRYLPPAAP